MVSTSTIREKMELYVQLVNKRDIDAILELYDDNATVEDPVGSEPLAGIEAISRFYREGLGQSEASAEQTGEVRTTISGEGAIPFQVKVTFEGRPCVITVIDVMQFNDAGKITSMKAYWSQDNLEVLA
ncbi:nuclear transport factor 2 family protein [Endozoicomonas atrinae]|uniref:nuclear transport factor 2 family protein n=1 Tax=Endozoicomonas atrinae TaxID=1333660 RepID=UPI003B001CAE